ncbi:MAG: biotin transporter BioY [Clostridia bacterium]|nr:biotin transporter BioY [Clostridia bacterium]
MSKIRTLDLCYVALFTALITVCGWICLPLGELKYTLQLLAVLICGGLLGWKRGLISVFAYVLLGAVGVPVFSGFSAGLFASPTGGYIVGFLFTVIVTGLGYQFEMKDQTAKKSYWLKLLIRSLFMVLGVLLCYASATLWFILFQGTDNAEATLSYALFTCVAPYLWFDALKIILALFLIERLKKFMK